MLLETLLISLIETESESGKESKGDIDISVKVVGNFVMLTGEVSGFLLHQFLIIATYFTWHNFRF